MWSRAVVPRNSASVAAIATGVAGTSGMVPGGTITAHVRGRAMLVLRIRNARITNSRRGQSFLP